MQRRCARLVLIASLLSACESPTDPRTMVGSVEIAPPQSPTPWFSMLTGDELPLQATVKAADGSAMSNMPIVWQSSHPLIATVDSTGLVRAAPTYASCNNFERPFYACSIAVSASVGSRSDTTTIFVGPRIVTEGQLEVTVTVGDTVVIAPPVGKVDGRVVCSFFIAVVYPVEIVLRDLSSGKILAVGPGDGEVGFMGTSTLCQQRAGWRTVVHVLPR